MVIAIDFDGTCVTHEYPEIGKDIGSAPVLRALVNNGHKLVLHTMRSGNTLAEAQAWFAKNNIELYGVNKNPTQENWTHSPKAFAHLYIDDAGLGIPLVRTLDRPYVDWRYVIIALAEKGCLMDDEVGPLITNVINAQNDLTIFQ